MLLKGRVYPDLSCQNKIKTRLGVHLKTLVFKLLYDLSLSLLVSLMVQSKAIVVWINPFVLFFNLHAFELHSHGSAQNMKRNLSCSFFWLVIDDGLLLTPLSFLVTAIATILDSTTTATPLPVSHSIYDEAVYL